MSRERMNWDWLNMEERIRLVTYSSFLTHGLFRVRIMIGKANADGTDNLGPRSTPWKVINVPAKSHDSVLDFSMKIAKKTYKVQMIGTIL